MNVRDIAYDVLNCRLEEETYLPPISIKDSTRHWLEENEYQGLYNSIGCCCCGIDALFPCGLYQGGDCEAAYKFDCDECIREGCEKRTEEGLFYHPNNDYCKPIHPVRLGE